MKKKLTILICFCVTLVVIASFSMPVNAATKTQSRTGVGANSTAVVATMTFNNNGGTLSGGYVNKVVRPSSHWYATYINKVKTPYRYSGNKYYGAKTSGMWIELEQKGFITNINVTGFR